MNKKGGCLKVIGIVFGAFAILFVVVMIIAVNSPDTKTTNATQPIDTKQAENAAPAKPDLELLELNSKSDEYSRYVVGKIKNNSKKKRSYVQVEINLYNKSDELIGSTMTNINNLASGETWSFKAYILEEDAVRFEVKDITGW